MNKAELVFIPIPGHGHLVSTVEIAKLLVQRDQRLHITVLIMKLPLDSKIDSYIEKLYANPISERIRFIRLPEEQNIVMDRKKFLTSFLEKQKPHVKEAVMQLNSGSNSSKLAGFVIDMFCTCMIDIANELGVPSYLFFTSSVGSLSHCFYVQTLKDEQNKDITEFKNSEELPIPGFHNAVPAKLLPGVGKEVAEVLVGQARWFRETKGIMVNTFKELESSVVEALSTKGIPPLYPVGPILNINGKEDEPQEYDIINWLDDQPPLSVVFLCFGSMGSFEEDQIREIAIALENSGHRFLWAFRKPPPKDKIVAPSDYANPNDVLPDGFLGRTAGIGKVAGWVPQVKVLSHPSIGGFVSHCGWNSILESIWFGVPIATWPLYAEQHLNAFCLLKEYGLAEEIKMDYRKSFTGEREEELVSADVIEKGIRGVMEMDVEKRKKVKEISQLSRKAFEEGGSSHRYLGQFIDDIFNNMP